MRVQENMKFHIAVMEGEIGTKFLDDKDNVYQ